MATPKKSRAAKTAPDTVDKVEAPITVNTKPLFANNNKEQRTMTSILSFSEDIATAEAPVPLPEGDYPAEIRAAEVKTSQNTGNDYGSVQFFISADSYPADYVDGDPDGAILTYNKLSTKDTPANRHRMRKFIESIGAKGGASLDMNDWIGLTATVQIKHSEYEGEKRAEIVRVLSA